MTEEKEIPWGLVVESDKIYSPKTKRWHEVAECGTHEGVTRLRIAGMAKYITRDPQEMTRVQRGATGKAVDIIAVVFSGATVPEHIGIQRGIGPTMDDTLKEKDE